MNQYNMTGRVDVYVIKVSKFHLSWTFVSQVWFIFKFFADDNIVCLTIYLKIKLEHFIRGQLSLITLISVGINEGVLQRTHSNHHLATYVTEPERVSRKEFDGKWMNSTPTLQPFVIGHQHKPNFSARVTVTDEKKPPLMIIVTLS